MIELINVYKHFGFEMNSKELADYLPLMLDFHKNSLERSEMDQIGLRRWFLEKQFLPGIKPLKKALLKYESTYANLVDSLEVALQKDAEMMEDQPLWEPPPNDQLQDKRSITQQS